MFFSLVFINLSDNMSKRINMTFIFQEAVSYTCKDGISDVISHIRQMSNCGYKEKQKIIVMLIPLDIYM